LRRSSPLIVWTLAALTTAPLPRAWGQDLRAEATVRSEVTYDTNPVLYNDRDVRRLREGVASTRYLITQPDDVAVSPLAVRITVDDALRLFHVEGALGVAANDLLYQANGVLNRSEFELFATPGGLTLSDTYSPRRYRREYRQPQTRVYASAFYTQHWLSARFQQDLTEWLELRLRLRLRTRRFEDPFASRDSTTGYPELKVVWRLSKIVRLTGGYQYVVNAADGGAGDHDRSYREHDVQPEVRLRPFDPLVVRAQLALGFRSYTTEASASFDPVYRDRKDDLRRLTVNAAWSFDRHLSVDVETVQETMQATRPHDVTVTDEQTSFNRSQYTLGLEYTF